MFNTQLPEFVDEQVYYEQVYSVLLSVPPSGRLTRIPVIKFSAGQSRARWFW